mgnify:CR=1 FL=1
METPEKPSRETLERWNKDPNNWIGGFLYYNKQDKRILVSKRNPLMGFTVNFANPKAYFFVICVIMFFSLVLYKILLKK